MNMLLIAWSIMVLASSTFGNIGILYFLHLLQMCVGILMHFCVHSSSFYAPVCTFIYSSALNAPVCNFMHLLVHLSFICMHFMHFQVHFISNLCALLHLYAPVFISVHFMHLCAIFCICMHSMHLCAPLCTHECTCKSEILNYWMPTIEN